MAQDFISLGLDVSGFDDAKFRRVQEFIALFKQLDKYDGKAYKVVLGEGLIEFNKSITETSKLLTDINGKLTSLTSALNGTSGGSTKAASSTKQLTKEQAELKVKLQEANRALIEQAKANDASVQSREKAKKAAADLKKIEKELADQQKAAAAQQRRDQAQAAAEQKRDDKKKQAENERNIARAKRENAAASSQLARDQAIEAKTTEKLISDYEQLKLAQKDQATNYANLFIAHGGKAGEANKNPAVKAAFDELQATSTTINQIERGLDKASQGAGQFGRTLTQGLSGIRTLAYILPGIGIAGIFNLAFEAIGNVISQMGLLGGAETKQIEFVNKMKEAWNDLSETYDKVYDQRLKLASFTEGSLGERETKTGFLSSQGQNRNTLFPNEINDLKERVRLANQTLNKNYGNDINSVLQSADRDLEAIKEKAQEINRLQEIIDAHSGKTFLGLDDKERLKAEANVKLLKTETAALEFEYKNKEQVIEEFYNSQKDLSNKQFEYEKFLADEARKQHVENNKNDIAVRIDRNSKILDADISSEQTRIDALTALRDEQLRLNKVEAFNVTDNISSTEAEKNIARNKLRDENIRAEEDYEQKVSKLREDYRQQRLQAQSEIDQSEINSIAIRNEKIANNEENSLQERLDALSRYIQARQKLQDIQYERDIDKESLKTGDDTALKLLEEIDAKRAEQKANIQADVEKRVYDIVYQSTQKQLKLILDENKITIEKNKERYGLEVKSLTDSFRAKKISYTKYKDELKKIDDTYQREALDKTIEQDKQAVEKLRENLIKNVSLLKSANDSVSITQQANINAKESGDEGDILKTQKEFDEATGLYEGYLKAVQNGELSLSEAVEKQKEDEFKRNNIRLNDDLKLRRQHFQAIRQIEQALYNTVKEVGDREYQYRLDKLSKVKTATDEQYQYEIDAINKSSLSEKDKAALDIQLNAQRKQAAEELAREERRIKHDQAVFDRDIAIAHIILSTAEAVASTIAIPALAIAAGIAGAAQLAVAASVRIPEYEKGTGPGKHKGGLARTGEGGKPELILEPYKSPYLVFKDNISYLPPGTEVIPMRPAEFGGSVPKDDTWKQTIWLAKQFRKAVPQIKNSTTINIDLGFERYKHKQLYGR